MHTSEFIKMRHTYDLFVVMQKKKIYYKVGSRQHEAFWLLTLKGEPICMFSCLFVKKEKKRHRKNQKLMNCVTLQIVSFCMSFQFVGVCAHSTLPV